MLQSIHRSIRVLAAIGAVALFGSATANAAEPYKQLQREWWQWAMSIPASINPIYDKTGNRCGLASVAEYWFLAGNTGGALTRDCTIPPGVELLVPIVNNFCFPDATIDAATCISETDGFIESYGRADLTLKADGQPAPFFDVRDTSEWFIAVDANGMFGYKPGVYKANIARGYWGVIDTSSWAPGTLHTVELAARGAFGLAVTYRLTVAVHSNVAYLP